MTSDRREELQSAIESAKNDPALATYVVRGTHLGDGALTRITLEKDLTARVIGDVLAHAEQTLTREFLPYDPSYQLASNQVIVDDLAAAPPLQALIEITEAGDVAADEPGAASSVIGMIHRVEGVDPRSAVTVVRLKGAGIATRRARGISAMLPRHGIFEEVHDEILYYEPRFDALVVAGTLVVRTITLLSRQLEAPERAQRRARETFARATSRIAIEGADALAEAVASDPAMVAKMMALARLLDADPQYAALLTTESLVDFVRADPSVEIEVVGEGADARLVYDQHPQRRYRIVKMLADDFLFSRLSGRTYEAGSKQRLDAPSS